VIDLVDRHFVFIAGGGKYGSGALKWFLKKRGCKVVVCDEDESCQASNLVEAVVRLEEPREFAKIKKSTLLVGNVVDALARFFSREIVPEIIIPCVPLHLAAKVLTVYLVRKGLKVKPCFESLRLAFQKAQLVGVEYRLNQDYALAVASKMPFDMQCVSGCNQPQVCPVTKKKLLKPMYDLTAETLSYGNVDCVKVLRSHLLAPNIGGFHGEELKQTLDLCIKNEPCTIGLATSCSCHAVMNIVRIGD
jgi:hypothetical protein